MQTILFFFRMATKKVYNRPEDHIELKGTVWCSDSISEKNNSLLFYRIFF